MSDARHPVGTGLWSMTPKEGPHPRRVVEAAGHTAIEAWRTKRHAFPNLGFNEVRFELVADVAPAVEQLPPVSPAIVQKVRRRLRQQGVAV